MIKKIFIPIVLLSNFFFITSCATSSSSDVTLAPLPTFGLNRTADVTVVITDPPPTTTWTDSIASYLDSVHTSIDVPVSVTDSDLLSYSDTWCDFMRRGMGKSNVTDWINEMAADQSEIDLWMITAKSSAFYICPDQEYKWNP